MGRYSSVGLSVQLEWRQFSYGGGSISIHDWCSGNVFICCREYCSWIARIMIFLESGWLNRLWVVDWQWLRLYYRIEICWESLFIEVCVFDFKLQVIDSLDFFYSVWIVVVPYRMTVTTVGTFDFICFILLASLCGMFIAAFDIRLLSSALKCIVFSFLAIVVLCKLELEDILLGRI